MCIQVEELCWGDAGLYLRMPTPALGGSAVGAAGTPEQVRQDTRTVIQTLGRGGGLIIAPDQEIMADVPADNVVAYVETVRENREKVLRG